MLETPESHTSSSPEPSEVEWQLDAEDLDVIERWLEGGAHAGLTVRAAGRKQIVDHYIDTTDLRLYAAGYATRLRGASGKAEVTLKSVASEGDADSGLRRRLELNEPLRYALLHCLATARGTVTNTIRQHAAIRELRVLFTVRTDRRIAIASSADGVDLGEVALDDTTIEAGDRTGHIRRVEVEALTPTAEAALAPFVETLRATHGLSPGTTSKFGSGLDLAVESGLIEGSVIPDAQPAPVEGRERISVPPPQTEPPPAAPLAPPASVPDGSVAALVRDVVAEQHVEIADNEAGTRLGEDIEALHDMRVAVRRLRTALRLFAKVLPSASKQSPDIPSRAELDASLRWLAAELGVVRDLDVQLERIEEWRGSLDAADAAALDPLAELLREQRHDARAAMIDELDSPRLDAVYAGLGAIESAGQDDFPKRALRPAVAVLPGILDRQSHAFRGRIRQIEAQADAPASLLHETRIRAKRLRYAAEFTQRVYGKPAKALISSLKRAQDVLGLHQDAEVAIDRLRSIATEAGDRLPPQTLFAMGEVAQRYRESQRTQRAALNEAATAVRKRSRQLRQVARTRRRDA